MRVSATQVRILMMVVNLALAGGVAAYYFYGLLGPERERTVVNLIPLDELMKKADTGPAGPSPLDRVGSAAAYLIPAKPSEPVVPTPPGAEEPPEEEAPAEEIAEGGPLAEEWEYVWCAFFPQEPRNTRVKLRKKQAAGPTSRISSSVRSRIISRRTSGRSRVSSGRSISSRAAGQEIFLTVRDRRYTDENLKIDILIDQADPEKLVYREFENPGKPYALKRVAFTRFVEKHEDRIVPPGIDEEESGDGAAGAEEKKKYFEIRSRDYEDVREEQYEAIVGGKKVAGELKGAQPRQAAAGSASSRIRKIPSRTVTHRTVSPRTVTPRTMSSRPGASSRTASRSSSPARPAGGPVSDPKERARQLGELRKTTSKLPPDARRKLRDALRGAK